MRCRLRMSGGGRNIDQVGYLSFIDAPLNAAMLERKVGDERTTAHNRLGPGKRHTH